jgi:hypothetical protein
MRRLLFSLAVLSLFGTAVAGCSHTAGICDCLPDSNCGHAPGMIAPVVHHVDGHAPHAAAVQHHAPIQQEPPTLKTPRNLPGVPGKKATH